MCRRRQLLALCGSLFAGAGCVSMGDETKSPPTDTVTPVPGDEIDSPIDTDEPTEWGNVDIRGAAVQPGVVGPNSPDSIGVFDDAGQYFVATVKAGSPAPPLSEFQLHFDGSTFSPTEYRNGLYRDGEWGVRYADGRGPIVFGLPETGDASDARLSWPGGEWTPPDWVRERLEAPLPQFSVTLDGPETVGPDEDPRISIAVTNEGERSGSCAVALNRSGPRIAYAPVKHLREELAPGESITDGFVGKSPYEASPPREAVYRLDAPGEENDAVLRISPKESTTAGE